MSEQEMPPLVFEDYKQMRLLISALWNDAVTSGADPLTLACALCAEAIQRLLCFLGPNTVASICSRQAEIIAAMQEREEAGLEH